MVTLAAGMEIFEGIKPERIVWLPSITLGYIYSVSAFLPDFALAVVAIGGARFIIELIRSESFDEEDSVVDKKEQVESQMSTLSVVFNGILMVLYLCAIVWGILQLFVYFTHEDLFLVGLAGSYWGILLILVRNLISL
jgi:hypothetical protein